MKKLDIMEIRKHSLTGALVGLTGLGLVAISSTGFAADASPSSTSSQASSQSQGMYSADRLMDAHVYAKGDSEHAIGEVDDVLLDNNMTIKSFVVETNGKFGLGGKSYVVSPSQLSVQTLQSKKPTKPSYRVNLDMTRDALAKKPVYSDSWWTNAQSQASDAWQQTKKSASSAWTEVKGTTSNLFNGGENKANNAANATGNAADKTANAADSAADKTGNAVDSTADKAGNATN
jgi:hypothetical protein